MLSHKSSAVVAGAVQTATSNRRACAGGAACDLQLVSVACAANPAILHRVTAYLVHAASTLCAA